MSTSIRDLLYAKERLEEVAGMLPEQGAPTTVLGVVVEIGLPQDTVMIAGYANGDARLFWGTGGGFLGELYQFPDIAEAAKALCACAKPLIGELPLESDLPSVPAADVVRVAVLTLEERYASSAAGPEIIKPGHMLNATFTAANKLFEQLQVLQEQMGKK